jgi:hypothetical protein
MVLFASFVAVTSSAALAAQLTPPLTFVGITPCRIIDTRTGSGFSGFFGPPALVANADRSFQITGTTTGTPTQCGIPDAAAAISVNFTVTGFTSAGDIRVFPAGAAAPLASIVNYSLENIANATTVPLGPTGGGHNGITVRADVAATNFIADVNGYYVPASTLASGETVTGVFAVHDTAPGAGFIYAILPFPRKLASAPSAPNANFIIGATPTANCPGSVANPQAAAGQLCAYTNGCGNTTLQCFAGGTGCGSGMTSSAFISLSITGAGTVNCFGSWALTAP